MKQQTAVVWLYRWSNDNQEATIKEWIEAFEQAKAMEKDQIGFTEEQAKQIWKAGQEYWKTSGSSITFEELIDNFKKKTILQRNI